jgi:hypothetical protein
VCIAKESHEKRRGRAAGERRGLLYSPWALLLLLLLPPYDGRSDNSNVNELRELAQPFGV